MKERLKELTKDFFIDSHCDAVAVGVLDFDQHKFDVFEVSFLDSEAHAGEIYFDLASLTKPLVNSLLHISQNINDPTLELILNHRAGIPAWGLLSKSSWKEQILSYDVKESDTVYSDFSALRYMLELEKKIGKNLKEEVFKNLSDKIIHWLDLPNDKLTLQNGYYGGKPNIGKVHDPNAYNIKEFLSHAGLFGTVEGLCETLINFNKNYNLLERMQTKSEHRFKNGFDTVTNPQETLAGAGCSDKTFGHLGFTGTSFWIDPDKKLGHVILSNATKFSWYDKKGLNLFRKELGALVWK